MQIERIFKKFSSWEEYFASEEFKHIYKDLDQHSIDIEKRVNRRSLFLRGYVTTANPDKNYGQPFRLFKHYITDDGLFLIKEETPVNMLSNQPFIYTVILEETGLIIFADLSFSRDKREWLVKNQITVL